jgi:FaeA-like protein
MPDRKQRQRTIEGVPTSEIARAFGKLSYQARLKRFGLERLQEIARENGKKGGRPKISGKN